MKQQNNKHRFMVTLVTNDRRDGAAERLGQRLTREVELQFGTAGTVRPIKKRSK